MADSTQNAYPNESWILTATILASSMAFIDGSALNVALPALQTSLQASGADLLWIINAYLLMLAALILVGGSLGDRLGRKKVFMIGIALFGAASLACGLSPTVGWIIAARIMQGIGGALMIPGSLAIITATIAPKRRGRAIGTWSAASTLVTVAGPILGGTLSDLGLWRGVFLINLPLAALALVVLATKVPETRDETITGPVDVLGAVLITLGLGGVTYGFISAPGMGFGSPLVAGTLAVGVVCLVLFMIREARSAHPMLPLQLFKSRTFSGTNLLTLFLYGGLSVGFFFLSLNLVQVQGYSKTEAGLATLPFAILLTVMSRWAGGLVDRRGPRLPLILGPALAGAGFFWMSFAGLTDGPNSYWTSFLPGIALFGVGMGFTVAPLSTSVMGSVETHYSGVASGINNAVSRTAGVLAIAVVGSVALIAFSSSLGERTASLSMPPQAHQSLMAEAGKLGGASVPGGVTADNANAVSNAIKLSFVDTFRLVMLISAALAWAAALTTFLLISPGLSPAPTPAPQGRE
jgi:EmrB/QacA subfamily drug resistance transporter